MITIVSAHKFCTNRSSIVSYFGIIRIIIIDYLRPASFGSADTYCYDIDIRKFLLFLNH